MKRKSKLFISEAKPGTVAAVCQNHAEHMERVKPPETMDVQGVIGKVKGSRLGNSTNYSWYLLRQGQGLMA